MDRFWRKGRRSPPGLILRARLGAVSSLSSTRRRLNKGLRRSGAIRRAAMSIDQIVTDGLIAVFTHPGAALTLSGLLFTGCLAVLATTWLRRVRPLTRALLTRIWAVSAYVPRDRADKARSGFARNADAIHDAMMKRGPETYALQRDWLDFQQSFVELEPEAVSSASRAGVFFAGAGDPGRSMEWWANIFVALGLMLTFLGIVAALAQATRAIGVGADQAAMQTALAGLLGVAAAKFWTSIAGVGSSLVLRMVGRRWRDMLEGLEDQLCEVLDAGVRHISPQAIALRQLSELQRLNTLISRQLETASPAKQSSQTPPSLLTGVRRSADLV